MGQGQGLVGDHFCEKGECVSVAEEGGTVGVDFELQFCLWDQLEYLLNQQNQEADLISALEVESVVLFQQLFVLGEEEHLGVELLAGCVVGKN